MRFLEREGFVCIRIRGSHHYFLASDGRTTMVPLHGNRDIGVGLLRTIARDMGLSVPEFLTRLRK